METVTLTEALDLFNAIFDGLFPIILSVYLIAITFKIFMLFF